MTYTKKTWHVLTTHLFLAPKNPLNNDLKVTQTHKHITQMNSGPPCAWCAPTGSPGVLDQSYESRISHEKLEHSSSQFGKTNIFHASFGCFQSNDSGKKRTEYHCDNDICESFSQLASTMLPPDKGRGPSVFQVRLWKSHIQKQSREWNVINFFLCPLSPPRFPLCILCDPLEYTPSPLLWCMDTLKLWYCFG